MIVAILASRPHPEQGFRTCLGVLRLFRDVTRDRAEAVSARAVEIGGLNCKSIASLIANHKAARQSTESTAMSITPICVALITFIKEIHPC